MSINKEAVPSTTSVETFVEKINNEVRAIRKSSIRIFELMKEANDTLSNQDYKKVIKNIDVEKSTINKIEKIFDNELLMLNIEKLPVSWGTLYEMSLIDTEVLQSKIESKMFNLKTTKKEVSKVRDELKESAKSSAVTEEESAKAQSNDEEPSAKVITLTLIVNSDITKDIIETDIQEITDYVSDHFTITNNLQEYFSEVA